MMVARKPGRGQRSPLHQKFSHTFTNELGRRIEVTVQDATVEKKPGIAIWVKGPDSFTENALTLNEARALAGLLTFMLERGRLP